MQHFNADRQDAHRRAMKGKRLAPTKSLNKLAAVSALHQGPGPLLGGGWAPSSARPRECHAAADTATTVRPAPNTAFLCLAHLPWAASERASPQSIPQLALHVHTYELAVVAGAREPSPPVRNHHACPMTRSGNRRRCTSVERALELPLSIPMEGTLRMQHCDNARSCASRVPVWWWCGVGRLSTECHSDLIHYTPASQPSLQTAIASSRRVPSRKHGPLHTVFFWPPTPSCHSVG